MNKKFIQKAFKLLFCKKGSKTEKYVEQVLSFVQNLGPISFAFLTFTRYKLTPRQTAKYIDKGIYISTIKSVILVFAPQEALYMYLCHKECDFSVCTITA